MQFLDADKGERLESSNGRVAMRDIVQFVPLRDVQDLIQFKLVLFMLICVSVAS
jgi:Copine